ncbi:uncharacterized protein [Penaeus vannamei]|uniref:uncharacterized protein n=1 Tax=Penaeus vannamei TaxID=6689 RepID=UPI00387F4E4A
MWMWMWISMCESTSMKANMSMSINVVESVRAARVFAAPPVSRGRRPPIPLHHPRVAGTFVFVPSSTSSQRLQPRDRAPSPPHPLPPLRTPSTLNPCLTGADVGIRADAQPFWGTWPSHGRTDGAPTVPTQADQPDRPDTARPSRHSPTQADQPDRPDTARPARPSRHRPTVPFPTQPDTGRPSRPSRHSPTAPTQPDRPRPDPPPGSGAGQERPTPASKRSPPEQNGRPFERVERHGRDALL